MAKTKRGFSPTGIPEKQDDYHGGCKVFRLSPDIMERGARSVNVVISFEEALRLDVAIRSAVQQLNRYNRAAKSGKEMGLLLSLKPGAIAVAETKLVPVKRNGSRGAKGGRVQRLTPDEMEVEIEATNRSKGKPILFRETDGDE